MLRIRSKSMVIIYKNLDSLNLVKEHLETVFGINKHTQTWLYVIRKETDIFEKTTIIAYLDCNFTPDVYTSRLSLQEKDEVVDPSVYCKPEKDFLLRYILTFYNSLDTEREMLTNMSLDLINKHAVILNPTPKSSNKMVSSPTTVHDKTDMSKEKSMSYGVNSTPTVSSSVTAVHDRTNVSTRENPVQTIMPSSVLWLDETDMSTETVVSRNVNSVPATSSTKSTVKSKPTINEKQTAQFNRHCEAFKDCLGKSEPSLETIKELTRILGNMINYRSKFSLSTEQEDQIKKSQSDLVNFKKQGRKTT